MSVAHYPSYLPRQYRRARLGILILVLLGLMSFVAVRDMAGQCRITDEYLTGGGKLLTEGGQLLVTGRKITRCELTVGGWLRIAISEQVADILRRFGIPVSYI
jgi:hypothetical protein